MGLGALGESSGGLEGRAGHGQDQELYYLNFKYLSFKLIKSCNI